MRNVLTTAACLFALGMSAAPALAQDAAAGAKVYADQKCASCHAIAGKGNAKGALDDVGSKLTADEIRQWIVDPVAMTAKAKATRKPPMAAKYASLPKADLDALVGYLSSLKSSPFARRVMVRHPLSIAGAWLVTISTCLFLVVVFLDLFGFHSNPYVGLIFFLIVPMFFVLGLAMIPAGLLLARRRERQGLAPRRLPRIDLNDPVHRRAFVIVLALSIANVLIVSLAAVKGIEYMETPQFCGAVCHVMEPEYVAHRDGAHSRVACVSCHVGSGAQSFVYYKLNGMRQLAHLVAGSYPTPIPSPVFNLRPATETCATCHSPETFHGDKVQVVPDYASDEANTDNSTHLVLHVGGGRPEFGLGAGIHWHTNARIAIDFVALDPKREQIPYVRMTDADGVTHEYRAPDVDEAKVKAGELRRMDCVDCHNRPTHTFFATPERAVDMALARGAISHELPFARRQAVEVLKAEYPDTATASREIDTRLRSFYASAGSAGAPPNKAQVDALVAATQFLYLRSVFPKMKVTWGTHLSNLGHTDTPGCFRCHDDQHKSADGRVIRQDCELCHAMQ